jgi:hypothetical protein
MITSPQLTQLIDELHQVNEALIEAARPLNRLSELSSHERQHTADELRAGLKRWENVTQRIDEVLHDR